MTREELEALAERIENEIGWRQFGIYNGPRLSLRDYFAGQTLVGFLAGLSPDAPYVEAAVARSCYAMADAMLKAREA